MNEKDETCSGERWTEALMWYNAVRGADDKQRPRVAGYTWHEWYADNENRRVFDELGRLLGSRAPYRYLRRPSKGELDRDDYDLSVPIADWLKAHAPHDTKEPRLRADNWWWIAGGVAGAAVLTLFLFSSLWFGPTSETGVPTHYQTGVGGLKEVGLRDGSTIILGGQTKLYVSFSAERRSVKLIEGQAWFVVAHNAHWPFVVTAGNGTITAVGTAFCVTRDSDRVVVAVTEGAVEILARLPPPISPNIDQRMVAKSVLAPIRIKRGEELAFRDNGALSPIKATDTHAATAWTQGRLTFDDQSLRYVIETVDRYSSRHIIVSPSAGALRFTGIVFDNEIEDWLQSLEGIFPVSVDERGADVSIQIRSSTPTGSEGSR